MAVDWIVVGTAVVVGAGALLAYAFIRFFRELRTNTVLDRWLGLPDLRDSTVPERRDTLKDLMHRYGAFSAATTPTVDALLAEVKTAYDLSRDRIKAIEAKATTLIGIVTTGLGALAILGDPTKVPSRGVWLAAALVAFAVAFMTALLAIAPRASEYPDLSLYALRSTVMDATNAARVKFDFSQQLLGSVLDNNRASFIKGKLVVSGTALLGVGLAALILNYATPGGEKPAPTLNVIVSTPAPSSSPIPTRTKGP
jgi:hypothetical protein